MRRYEKGGFQWFCSMVLLHAENEVSLLMSFNRTIGRRLSFALGIFFYGGRINKGERQLYLEESAGDTLSRKGYFHAFHAHRFGCFAETPAEGGGKVGLIVVAHRKRNFGQG